MQKVVTTLILSLFVVGIYAQKSLDKIIPLTKEVKLGKLGNGITYYIRNNNHPTKSASFALVQNVGALMESDEQNGLAHFLEHMAFNGTTHFPGNTMLNTLERHGMNIGSNVNAYTSQNKTCYSINNVPTDRAGLTDTCLLILHDWCNELLLEEKEIEAERGVIVEEYRQRNSASTRVMNKVAPDLFNNSKYAQRDVIGKLEIIKNFEPETLRKFYHDWYRTDLQCVIVVGDVNVKKTEKKIKELFGSIPAVKNPIPRPEFKIDDHDDIKYVSVSDKDLQHSAIILRTRFEKDLKKANTVSELKQSNITGFCNSMIAKRFDRLNRNEEQPFLQGAMTYNEFVKGYDVYTIAIVPKEGKDKESLRKVMEIRDDILINGFTADELLMCKTEFLMSLENYYQNKDKRVNNEFIEECKNHYLVNSPMGGIDYIYKLIKSQVNDISLKSINDEFTRWNASSKNQIITTQGPEGREFLTKDEILEISSIQSNAKKTEKAETTSVTKLLDEDLQPGSIDKIEKIDDLNAQIWTLSNGARVIYKFNNYHPKTVSLKAKSPGGMSLVDADDLPSVMLYNTFAQLQGLGEHDVNTLEKILTGKTVAAGASIDAKGENIEAGCTNEYIESMFKLVYMIFEKPRFDEKKTKLMIKKSIESLEGAERTYSAMLQDSITLLTNSNSERVRLANKEFFESMDFETMKRIYYQRISNAKDWTFYLIGDVKEKEAKKLVCKYLGNIKSTNQTEICKKYPLRFPQGKTSKIYKFDMATPKAGTVMIYNDTLNYNLKNTFCFGILANMLNMKFFKEIREEAGGTYGVDVTQNVSRYPHSQFNLNIQFMCDPDQLDILHKMTLDGINQLVRDGVDEKDFNKIITGILSAKAREVKDVNYWNQVLEKYIQYGEDHTKKAMFQDIVKSLTVQDVNKFAKDYFAKSNKIDIKYMPK